MNDRLFELDAIQLSRFYAARSLSPVEVVRAVLQRIAACEPQLNALFLTRTDQALVAAKAAERRWAQGAPLSAFDGVPVTVKENLYTAGDPAPIGTAAGDMSPKPADSPPAARLREAGCVVLGKTTMPDFGMLSSGLSSAHGTTRNPWRLDLNPAGSSSGAGAAGAAGYGPWHVGTDIGGSVRLPAAHCALFGLKPSLGRIPIDPPYMGRVAGPMTRKVADAAALMNLLAQPDPRDFTSLPAQSIDYLSELAAIEPRGLKVAVLEDMGVGWPVEAETLHSVRAAARALEQLGAAVQPIKSFMTPAMLDGMQRFFEARSCADLLALDESARSRVLPFIVEWATWRARAFTGAEVMAAYTQVQAMREAAVRATRDFDLLLSPTAPVPSYPASSACPHDDPHRALDHIAFTVAWNMSEQPAASINWCFGSDGLPRAVQIVGRRHADVGVLRAAHLLESLRPSQPPWPEPPFRGYQADAGVRQR